MKIFHFALSIILLSTMNIAHASDDSTQYQLDKEVTNIKSDQNG
jgi:hypothetical protein